MSAPDTNIEKQARRHKGPLIGISVGVVAIVAILAVYSGVFVADDNAAELSAPAIATN